MIVVHTEAGIEKIPMKAHHHWEKVENDHQHEPHHNREEEHRYHLHGLEDPHVWLSPPLVILQARNILQTIIRVDPTHRPIYEKNYRDFVIELVELDQKLRTIFAGNGEDLEFMAFHPSWEYFAEAYGLVQIPVEIEGKEPKPAELEKLIRYAKGKGIKAVFVQPQFSSQSARTIAKGIGGQVVFVDPLALDWANNLLDVAAKFEAALTTGSTK
jgi:zinc transport system substrate-binding protein